MTMRVEKSEFVGASGPIDSYEPFAEKMALDFEASVFLRMKELGLKQKDLAQLLGMSPAAVSKMLSGGTNLTLKSIAKIAVALGCDVPSLALTRRDDAVSVPGSGVAKGEEPKNRSLAMRA